MQDSWHPDLQGGRLPARSYATQQQRAAAEAEIVWTPTQARRRASAMQGFMADVELRTGRSFHGRYEDLWLWSVQHIEEFWAAVWEHFQVPASRGYQCVLDSRAMPGARWFPGAALNFAEHALRAGADGEVVLIHLSELKPPQAVTRGELRRDVRVAATRLRTMGVKPGDRVAGCLPNGYEAAVGFLAAAAAGAVWVGVPPALGPRATAERLLPLKPKVLLAAGGHLHAGRPVDARATVQHLLMAQPGLAGLVWVETMGKCGPLPLPAATSWADFVGGEDPGAADFEFAQLDSGQALWAWFSAGTSGPCKTVMHSHTGVLLEALVLLGLHHDLGVGKRLYAHADTGDLLWHLSMAALATGATVVLHDGHATYPRSDLQWKVADDLEVTHLATTPAFIGRMRRAGVRPRETCRLARLESVILTGLPASPELFHWLHQEVAQDLWVAAASHCADVAGAFMAPCLLLPVRAGRMQCRALGHDVQAWSDSGEPLVGAAGELVCVQPLPSMPLGLWGDHGQQRRRATWFDAAPCVWRQGDLLQLDATGGGFIDGRCATALVRAGHTLGTAGLYDALDHVAGVDDALLVCCEREAGGHRLLLFVKLAVGAALDDALISLIQNTLEARALGHFMPDSCHAVPEIPRSRSGDRMELPVRRILMGAPVEQSASLGALSQPGTLDWYAHFARAFVPSIRSGARSCAGDSPC